MLRKALRALGKAGIAKVLKPIIDGKPVRVLARKRDAEGNAVDEVVEIDPEPAVRVKAVDVALRYGLGTADRLNVDNEHHGEIRHTHARRDIELPALGSVD